MTPPMGKKRPKHEDSANEWPTALMAFACIDVTLAQTRAWFTALADHPERYRFASHNGFSFTRGRFGEVGALFQTEEVLGGILMTLKFELTQVTAQQFTFALRHPVRSIYGRFTLSPLSEGRTRLELAVGSPHRGASFFLCLPVVRGIIQHQIKEEVRYIKESMEALFQEETWAS